MYEIPELEKKIEALQKHSERDRLRHDVQFAEARVEEIEKSLADMTRLRHCFETLAVDYTKRYVDMKQERDDIQLRLHAVDHAYNEQQTRENTLLRDTLQRNAEAMETIRRQREFIRTLYTSRKARKGKGSTSAQSERENSPKAKSGGNAVVSEGNLKRADVIRQEEGLRSGQIGCNGQAEMRPPCNHSYVTFTFGTVACIYCKKVHKLNETT